ncbi:hypothetical protein KK137_15050 [Croceibacterium sp. LX-88]|uniref:Transferrin-binding protein B C-lobe/N-lobe beta barrel domain-containing protein n=1 Tax=Croceibacterium selenioxidans TaxID=2838833 RepID=A0ABS5W7D4_9SPHN|nr:hypothetical protein [Croceibacterium selenioxidans]MBT2135655.1 hypothetical protein [Croceibacterium selenioxidans]
MQNALASTHLGGNFASAGSLKATGIKAKAISYDPVKETYTFYTTETNQKALELSKQNATTGAVAGYSYFKPSNADKNDVVAVYNNRSGPVPLTYTSFAFARLPGSSDATLQAYVFGVPTTSLPTTGSATYSGIVGGNAQGKNGASYALTGTSTLNANFTTGKYSTSLKFTGVNTAGGAGLPTQTYNGNTAGFVMNGSPLNGSLSGSGTGSWGGKFFGPSANEFGYTFQVTGSDYAAVGVAAGKKN